MAVNIPYQGATSGMKARDEIRSILKRFGCTSLGFMDDFETKSLSLVFKYRDRQIQLKASAQGWAAMYLQAKPWTSRMQRTKQQYNDDALDQGLIAINSILRDWVKGQVTAIETGILQFDHVFLPYMVAPGGQTVAELIESRKLLELPGAGAMSERSNHDHENYD